MTSRRWVKLPETYRIPSPRKVNTCMDAPYMHKKRLICTICDALISAVHLEATMSRPDARGPQPPAGPPMSQRQLRSAHHAMKQRGLKWVRVAPDSAGPPRSPRNW
eukprot:7297455-Pyramimonas_sp.AAC.1